MPRHPCSAHRLDPAPVPPPVLDRIVEQIAEDHVGRAHASLVRVRPAPGGVDIGLAALPEGVHPAEALVGHVVSGRWVASGVVAPAWARPLAEAEAAATGTGTRTTVAMLVGRDGHVTSHVIGVAGVEAGGEAPVGRIPDLLLRTLGLPTPPPPVPAAEWWRAHWLDALVSAAAERPGEEPDPGHPVTGALPPALVQALVDEPEICSPTGWGRMRALAAAPDPPDAPGPAAVREAVTPFVDPAVAAWMDDGCFARWLLDALPSVDELLELAAALVTPGLLAQLREVSGRRRRDDEGEPAPQGGEGSSDAPR